MHQGMAPLTLDWNRPCDTTALAGLAASASVIVSGEQELYRHYLLDGLQHYDGSIHRAITALMTLR